MKIKLFHLNKVLNQYVNNYFTICWCHINSLVIGTEYIIATYYYGSLILNVETP